MNSKTMLSEEQIKEMEETVNSFMKKAKDAGMTTKELRTILDTQWILALTKSIEGQDWYHDIYDLHIAQEHYIGEKPSIPPADVHQLRKELIEEEVNETLNALLNDDLEGIADGVADSIVVLLGTAISYGIDIRPIWDEVHRTNMAKTGGPKRPDGKSLKPPGWQPPDIKGILAKQCNSIDNS